MFLGSTSLTILAAIINMVIYIMERDHEDVNQTAVIVIVAVIGTVLGVPILCFFGFHIILTVTGSTTRELLKDYKHDKKENKWCHIDKPLF